MLLYMLNTITRLLKSLINKPDTLKFKPFSAYLDNSK